MDAATLKRAAKKLEDGGLIKRVIRANRSNRFFLNVKLLQEQAVRVRANERQDQVVPDECPFDAPAAPDDDIAFADDANLDPNAYWMTGGVL